MKNLIKASVILSVLVLLIVLIKNAPKGNDYIQWEKEMIESGQMKIEKSEYFTKVDGVLKLK
jgi:hypothetical protein